MSGGEAIDEATCIPAEGCGVSAVTDDDTIFTVVCGEGDGFAAGTEPRVCSGADDCRANGEADTCGEAMLNDERMPGTTKVCLSAELCGRVVAYGGDEYTIAC